MTKVIAVISSCIDINLLNGYEDETGRVGSLYHQLASCSKVDRVIISTPDVPMLEYAKNQDFEFHHGYVSDNGTLAGTAQCTKKFWTADIVLDIPGVMNRVNTSELDALAEQMLDNSWMQIAGHRRIISDSKELHDPEVIKVVCNLYNKVLYFSRLQIPFYFDKSNNAPSCYKTEPVFAFRNKTLQELSGLQPSPMETAEGVPYLRWLENNYEVYVFPLR
jgi:3-deoxy-manno-octulosonate cytidylyltransferase (CMP-KDO synthetase)